MNQLEVDDRTREQGQKLLCLSSNREIVTIDVRQRTQRSLLRFICKYFDTCRYINT